MEQKAKTVLNKCLKDHFQTTQYTDSNPDITTTQLMALEQALSSLPPEFQSPEYSYSSLVHKLQLFQNPLNGDEDTYEEIGSSAQDCITALEQGSFSPSRLPKEVLLNCLQAIYQQAQQAQLNQFSQAQQAGPSPKVRDVIQAMQNQLNGIASRAEEASHNARIAVTQANSSNAFAKSALDEAKNAIQKAEKVQDQYNSTLLDAQDAATKAGIALEGANAAKASADLATQTANSAADKANNALDSARDIIPSMLTIVGIFVAIVIAVVSCYITILLTGQKINESGSVYPLPAIYAQYLLMGLILTTVLFLLIYLVSKLTNRDISACSVKASSPEDSSPEDSSPEDRDCRSCNQKCGNFKKFRKRYPYMFWLYGFFFLSLGAMLIWGIFPQIQAVFSR